MASKRVTLGFVILFLCVVPVLFAGAQDFTLSTYFPIPQGTFEAIRLYPQAALPDEDCAGPQDYGTIYMSETTEPYFCEDDGSGGGQWSRLGMGLWTIENDADGNDDLFPSSTQSYSDNTKVGLGTSEPLAHLHILDDQASNSNDFSNDVVLKMRKEDNAVVQIAFEEGDTDQTNFAIRFTEQAGTLEGYNDYLEFWGESGLNNLPAGKSGPVLSFLRDFPNNVVIGGPACNAAYITANGDCYHPEAKLEVRNKGTENILLLSEKENARDDSAGTPFSPYDAFTIFNNGNVAIGMTNTLVDNANIADLAVLNNGEMFIDGSTVSIEFIDTDGANAIIVMNDGKMIFDFDVASDGTYDNVNTLTVDYVNQRLGIGVTNAVGPRSVFELGHFYNGTYSGGDILMEGADTEIILAATEAGHSDFHFESRDDGIFAISERNGIADSIDPIVSFNLTTKNTGIMTTSPQATLHVRSPIAGRHEMFLEDSNLKIGLNESDGEKWEIGASDTILHMGVAAHSGSIVFNYVNPTTANVTSSGSVGIGVTPGSLATLHVDGDVNLSSGYCYYMKWLGTLSEAFGDCPSDERLKKEISPLAGSLEKIVKLQPVSFSYSNPLSNDTNNTGEHIGLVAQDVKEIFPQWVVEDNDGYYRIIYSNQVTYELLQAVKELKQKISDEVRSVQSEIEELMKENQDLRRRIHAM